MCTMYTCEFVDIRCKILICKLKRCCGIEINALYNTVLQKWLKIVSKIPKKWLKPLFSLFHFMFTNIPQYLLTYYFQYIKYYKSWRIEPPFLVQKSMYVWLFEFILFSFYESRFYCGVKICTTIVNGQNDYGRLSHTIKRACITSICVQSSVLQKNARSMNALKWFWISRELLSFKMIVTS